jgi:outer membrane protein assembly factor BamE
VRAGKLGIAAKRWGVIALIAIASTGCSSNRWGFPYKVGVQQGNWVTSEQVGLLYEGMTREQVRFALGSPTLTSVFHTDRWDYPYFYLAPNGKSEERNLTVFFQNGLLVKWQGDEQPDLQPFQIANETVEISKEQQQEAQLIQERVEGATGTQQIDPGIDFSTIIDTPPSSEPGALPDEPDQTPAPLM